MTTDLHAFLRSRRSVRRFKPDPIPAAALARLLETATYAPSAHNRQPWRFAVITNFAAKRRLAEAITMKFQMDLTDQGLPANQIEARVERTKRRLEEAPAAILLCRDVTAIDPQPDEAGRAAENQVGVQSVALAGLQLLLAAHAEGLGGTWICWPLFASEETRQVLDLPQTWQPEGMLFLGFPAESPATPERIPMQGIVKYF